MNKTEAEKARKKAHAQIKRALKKNVKPAKIAADTGYTPARIYQIKAEMVRAGELTP